MIRIHGPDLATVIPGFICVLIVHVIRYPELGEDYRMIPHVPQAFIPQEFQLIAYTISNRSFANLDSKSRREILATKNTDDINIVQSIPVKVRLSTERGYIHSPMLRQECKTVVVMNSMNHVRVIVYCGLQSGGNLHHGRLAEHNGVWPHTPDGIPVCSVMLQEI